MTDALVQFIRARLDEDEQSARAVGGRRQGEGSWTFEQSEVRAGDGTLVVKHTWAGEGVHIARHDPARTLREVAAKRRLLDLHQPGTQEYVDGDVCMVCTLQGDGPYYPCATLRLLALPYSDHPDYRDDWRP